jgi:hypothetical protein
MHPQARPGSCPDKFPRVRLQTSALLLRAAWARGRLSWTGAILAGIGYTAFNEGLVAQTWFRPGLNGFSAFRLGRLAGVNWCIVVGLCVFHTVFSMAIPIAAIQLRRAEQAPRQWLGGRGIAIAGASILLTSPALVLSDHAVRRSPDRMVAAAVAVCLPLLALVIPKARRVSFFRHRVRPERVRARDRAGWP